MANTNSSLPALRTTTLVVVLSVLVQLGLGIAMLTGRYGLADAHGGFGYLTFLASLVAAFFAWKQSKHDAGAKGLFMHALSLPVLALIQIGLAEGGAGNSAIKWVHVVLGIAFVGAAVSLYTLVDKRRRA